ncbi:MAG: FkbM family methyltransferase [Chitinophagales bacterium]|nr:FkbM family methyltransferase [Chitinophagales bacterium]
MKIRKIISAYRTKLLGTKTQYEEVGLLGRVLTVSVGTINKKTDKDDAWWYALAARYNKIYDIGANVGYSTILACLDQPGKEIVLADPNPLALQQAKENLERNGLGEHKTYINAFAGEKKGEQVKFYTLGTGSAGSMFGSHADSAKAVNAFYMVDTTTLDDMVRETGMVPELVKIDVEAAESYVLKGATELAAKQQTVFMVEMHAPSEMPMLKNAGLILDWCVANQYSAHYLKEHAPLTSPEQIAHRGRCHLLLLPEGMAYPEYLRSITEGDEVVF